MINFNTEIVTNMKRMFHDCSSLKDIKISDFNTDNAIDMDGMFSGCNDELQKKIRARYNSIRDEAFI